jgi:hypothetical protein
MKSKRPSPEIDWFSTPEPVREYIIYLERLIGQMQHRLETVEKRTEKLEARTRMNSQYLLTNRRRPTARSINIRKKLKKAKPNAVIKKGITDSATDCLIRPMP